MSDADKIHARFESFAVDFLSPLLAGGTLRTGEPLHAGMLPHFADARSSDFEHDQKTLLSFHNHASEYAPIAYMPYPDKGAMACAMACHNFAMLTDPQLDRAFTRGAAPKILEWTRGLIDAIPFPRSRGEVLARHIVLDRMRQSRRVDVVVKNWAYTYRFYGRSVPSNMTTLSSLRRVTQSHKEVDVFALARNNTLLAEDGFGLEHLLEKMISRSPRTELLNPVNDDFEFSFATLSVLSDPRLRHSIAGIVASKNPGASSKRFGGALRKLSEVEGMPGNYLYIALALIADLHLLAILDKMTTYKPQSVPGVSNEELFAAVFPALVDEGGEMAQLATLSGDQTLSVRDFEVATIRRRAEELRALAGQDAVGFAREIIMRAEPLSHPTGAVL